LSKIAIALLCLGFISVIVLQARIITGYAAQVSNLHRTIDELLKENGARICKKGNCKIPLKLLRDDLDALERDLEMD